MFLVLGFCAYLLALILLTFIFYFSLYPNFVPWFEIYYTAIHIFMIWVYAHIYHRLNLYFFFAVHTFSYIVFHTSSLKCPANIVVWSAVLHIYGNIFSSLPLLLHTLSLFLEVSSQYLLQWPIFPTGIIKTSSCYLYSYTNLLPSSSSSSHLSPNSLWSFSPQRPFFSPRVSIVV